MSRRGSSRSLARECLGPRVGLAIAAPSAFARMQSKIVDVPTLGTSPRCVTRIDEPDRHPLTRRLVDHKALQLAAVDTPFMRPCAFWPFSRFQGFPEVRRPGRSRLLSPEIRPHEADLRLTRRRTLQITLTDDVIIGRPAAPRNGYLSFKEAGVIG